MCTAVKAIRNGLFLFVYLLNNRFFI